MSGALVQAARALLEENTQTGVKDGRTYRFSVPSPGQYPFQWFWDSCFHAIAWSRIDPERAKDELRGLLAWQEPDGFIPHVVFWDAERVRRLPVTFHFLETRELWMLLPWGRKPRTSAHVQPPAIAQAVERIAQVEGGIGFVEETLPALERYYRWLASARDPDGDGLISIIAQFESGLDYSPAYDPAVGVRDGRPAEIVVRTRWPELENKVRFRFDLERIFAETRRHQEDVLVNTVYADALEALARLARRAGREELAAWAEKRAAAVLDALLGRSWDAEAGLFWNLVGPDERPSRVPTVISLMPLLLAGLPADVASRLVEQLVDPSSFWAPFPVPSVALHDPRFVPGITVDGRRLIWRGPASMNTNWFLVQGLRRHGEDAIAAEIAARSHELVERGGFNEFYNPLSGEPVGAVQFGWATLVIDL